MIFYLLLAAATPAADQQATENRLILQSGNLQKPCRRIHFSQSQFVMNGRIIRNSEFLQKVLRHTRQAIKVANKSEIGCLVELLFNIHKIALNRSERNVIIKFLPIIRYIGKCRDLEKARDLLLAFAHHFIRIIVQYTSRVQPFVAVTQKEANAIEMEKRLDAILQRKDLDPHLKMRLYQDRLARLANFRKENEIKDERSEPLVEEPPPLIDFYSPARQPYIDDFKVIQNYNYQPPPLTAIKESTPTRPPRPTLTPSLDWDDDHEALGFSPKNTPITTKKAAKTTRQDRELKNLQLPSYMQPRQPVRRGQKGSGSFANRLYVRAWI
ncbi:hypothetical protein PRIPAC_82712 [Pristionchus pacificus]|uniref:Uncharacterized protein n=1 Tax=Pristionchus pacificus TaxID=54126 RepID=A0A2A6CNK5_PRIPA|nr:hypothetical protein PRIPAC_82712 [Pristionchus pacificus]|eukprot:PDM79782.1 hypothetical protein PRIPAC_32361 [Pristionchus pacificus]